MAKANYTKPSSQLDLERRQKEGNENSSLILSTHEDKPEVKDENARDFQVEGNKIGAYVGVDPVYQNYADPTEKPLRAEGGPEKKIEDEVFGNNDGNEDEDETEEEDEDDKTGQTGQASGSTTPPPATPPAPATK